MMWDGTQEGVGAVGAAVGHWGLDLAGRSPRWVSVGLIIPGWFRPGYAYTFHLLWMTDCFLIWETFPSSAPVSYRSGFKIRFCACLIFQWVRGDYLAMSTALNLML